MLNKLQLASHQIQQKGKALKILTLGETGKREGRGGGRDTT